MLDFVVAPGDRLIKIGTFTTIDEGFYSLTVYVVMNIFSLIGLYRIIPKWILKGAPRLHQSLG